MLLNANNISFRYGKGSLVLQDFSLHVAAGEVVGLSGYSGCGKSTLARILAGYLRPMQGHVQLGGKPLPTQGYNPVQLVLQHPEQAINPRWRLGQTIREGWQPDKELLAAFGIQPEWLKRWPNELSGGELQRFCVVRALGPKTRFLIADEMTTMLDAITQAQIWQVVMEIAQKRKLGILLISHEKPLISRLCHREIQLTKLEDNTNAKT
ncbi:MAG: ATP-binding cassette domain-containing protein [Firmicutes bacterium]|nr:ATP-binding cassette domain-containing protein [Bacillota bacterium]